MQDQDLRLLCTLLGLTPAQRNDVYRLSGSARESLDSVVRDALYKLKARVLGRVHSARMKANAERVEIGRAHV